MLDIIKRIIVTLSGLAVMIYLISFLVSGEIIVPSEFINNNTLIIILIIVLVAFFTGVYGIYPINIKWHKTTLFVLGLILIVLGKQYLLNDIEKGIYVGDIVDILGVFVILFGSTGLLTTKNIKKKENEKNIEVIEV